ncbi:MAG: excinuclease ABC subunit C, partial [Methanoregula sp.]|nr:excinuclease ABC subunit C [Methanoregula sp.]
GGKGQLAAALDAIKRLELVIPVIAIAKKEEQVYVPGEMLPLVLDPKGMALRYIQEIRDEAHRFARAYHTLLRKKKMTGVAHGPGGQDKSS